MRQFTALFKKELLGSWRTYRLLILLAVFFAFGVMSPLAAKLMPELLASFAVPGMDISLPPPTVMDSWAQFFKNVSQMGLIVLAVVLGGTLSTELSRGTLTHLLTKGLPRPTVILSKYAAMALLWTAAYALAFLVTLLYSAYLFPGEAVANLVLSAAGMWLFGLFLLAALLAASALTGATYGALLLTVALLVALALLNISPALQDYNPLLLVSANVPLLAGTLTASSLTPALAVTAMLCALLVLAAVLLFRKRQL